MLLAIWLIGLGFVGVVGYVVWSHRGKHSARAAARDQRLAELMNEAQGGTAPRPAQAGATPPAPQPNVAAAAIMAAAGVEAPAAGNTSEARELVGGYGARGKVFAPEHAVLYYMLKTGLPDHEVLAHVSLSELLEPPPEMQNWERERRRRALAAHIVHCAVVSKSMKVVAAVDIVPASAHQPVFKMEVFDAVGMRYIRVDPKRMPKRQEVRELILGGDG